MSLVGIDLGTSGVRAVAVDAAGTEITSASRATSLHRPTAGWVEADAEEVLAAAVAAVGELTTHGRLADDTVDAVSFSVQGETIVPVDRDGRPRAPAPVSMDRRGIVAAERIATELGGPEVQRITGQPLHPMFSIYKVRAGGQAWTSSAVQRYQCLGDFVATRLGAEPLMDTTMAARTGAFDVERLQWSDALLEAAGVAAQRLPAVVVPGTTVGVVSAEAAGPTGLAAGTPIVVGSHDQASSFWGGGGRVSRRSVYSLGSSDCLTVGTSARPEGLQGTGFATYPTAGEQWLTLAGSAAGGWALEWFAGLVGARSPEALEALFDVPSVTAPALLVLPYLAGSGTLDNDPLARGAIIGLTLETARDELTRAFLESSGFELAKILDALTARAVHVGNLRVVGSGARNGRALRIRAAAAGVPMAAVRGHASARGAALQAAVGIGVVSSFADLPDPPVAPAARPDPATRAWYGEQRHRFRALYRAVAPLDHSLSTTKENR